MSNINLDNSDKREVTNFKVVRTWTNGFAQTCYQLENGTVLAFGYSGDELQVIQGLEPQSEAEKEAELQNV